MHYLISGIAKSGTTRLFSQLKAALESQGAIPQTFFEPFTDEELTQVLASPTPTLTKVLVGRVSAATDPVAEFQRHVLIYRDPRDQFISMLLYLFYDFQLNNDAAGYEKARDALARKQDAPEYVSTIELYRQIAEGVGRAPTAVFSRLHSVQRDYAARFKPYMLRYEDLVEGSALPDLESYLGMTLQADVEVPTEYARVARSRGYGDWRKWFNGEDLEFANREWGETIDALGYQRETQAGELSIDPQLSLDYVAQFAPHPRH
jgi:hypothetical protein